MKKAKKADARQQLERIIVSVLKASREDLDISRAELADRLGWKPEQIAELEIGRRIVRAADLFLTPVESAQLARMGGGHG